MARRRLGPPGGATVGDMDVFPPWWPNNWPPQIHVLRMEGYDWIAMYGTPSNAQGNYQPVFEQNPEDMVAYQDGAPDGFTGPQAFNYSCVWAQVDVAPDKRAPKPRARKTWETLSPGYRRDISGTMRRRFRLTTEAQFKHYYETAVDLSALRRHKPKTIVVAGIGRIGFPKGKTLADYPWLATWQRS